MQISTASSHKATTWHVETLTWDEFKIRVRNYKTADMSRAQYDKLSKEEQTATKNAGAFVGGCLKDGLRKKSNVDSRSMITLDIDNAPEDIITRLGAIQDTYMAYTTFKSLPNKPRVRVVIPLAKDIREAEYEPLTRFYAKKYGLLEYCDRFCFRATQLMFWPCYPNDVKPVFIDHESTMLDAHKFLSTEVEDWEDVSTWPLQDGERQARVAQEKAEDPLTKQGLIGVFCRAYTIHEAIDTFLSDVYEETDKENRYHLKGASSSGGVLVYDDKFLYSHHEHDPGAMQLLNAFDLVRVHLFGDLDKNSKSEEVTKLPSYKKMMDLVAKDKRVHKFALVEAQNDFSDLDDIAERNEAVKNKVEALGDDVVGLEYDQKGNLKNTISNLSVIIETDDRLKVIRYDLFADNFVIHDHDGVLPWTHEGEGWSETDLSCLVIYISKKYHLSAAANVFVALQGTVRNKRSFHPVREYFDNLPEWDGTDRAEDLLIKYLGAEDNDYTRSATNLMLKAAYARIFEPGVKFDYLITLVGPQGIGKSTLPRLLGRKWYSDSLTITDMKDKTGAEKLKGNWIMEVSELSGMRRTDNETIKGFLSRNVDNYRPSYGHTTVKYPRQCILIGTSNEDRGFLSDTTGNRRYLPIRVKGAIPPEDWDLTPEVIDQIWAEVKCKYAEGFDGLFMPSYLYNEVQDTQNAFVESDEREGPIQEYADMLVPKNFRLLGSMARRNYLTGLDKYPKSELEVRNEISIIEVWTEALGCDYAKLDRTNSLTIKRILTRLGWVSPDRSAVMRFKAYGPQRVFKRTKGPINSIMPENEEEDNVITADSLLS